MKRKYLLLILAAALTCVVCFAACDSKKNVTEVYGDLNIIVFDDYSQPVDGAIVTVVDPKVKAVKTDVNGLAAFKGLTVGSYAIKIEKEGYASFYGESAELAYGLADNIAVPETTSGIVVLHKLGASVKGKAVITINNAQQPAANAEIKLELQEYSFLKRIYTATTDSQGVYTFTELPENVFFNIYGVNITRDDIEYSASALTYENTGRLWDGVKNLTTNVSYTSAAWQFYITSSDRVWLQSHNSNIVIEFSLPVKISTLPASNIDVYINNSSGYYFINTAWSNNNKTLTISPVSGSWGEYGHVQLSIYRNNVVSETGITLSSSSSYYYLYAYLPGGINAPPAPTGLKLTDDSNMNYNDGSGSILKIEWTRAENTHYYVYYRNVKNTGYNSMSNSYQDVVGSKMVYNLYNYFSAYYFSNGESFEVIVYAYNSSNDARSATPAKLTISPRAPA